MLLGGKQLQFYQWDGDVSQLLDGVRASLNELAEGWTREQKDHCLQETLDAFKVQWAPFCMSVVVLVHNNALLLLLFLLCCCLLRDHACL